MSRSTRTSPHRCGCLLVTGTLFIWASAAAAAQPAPVQLTSVTMPSPTGSSPGTVVRLGAVGLFPAYEGIHGGELWRTDGTAAGTALVKDIHAGWYSGFADQRLVRSGDRLFFVADDRLHGLELWKTDGTSAGTQIVKDVVSGATGALTYGAGMVDVGGTLYFVAADGSLWKTNGSEEGTVRLKSLSGIGAMANVQGTLYFAGQDKSGSGLWKSNGTEEGTERVLAAGGVSYPELLTPVGSLLYFRASDASDGPELFRYDTVNGTVTKFDLNPGGGSNPYALTVVGSTLYFVADDGSSGAELWKSDASGTARVKDICTGSCSGWIGMLAPLGGELLFAADSGSGIELWKSNGTAEGTVAVGVPLPDVTTGVALEFGGRVYFSRTDQLSGLAELWKTDGTQQGTVVVTALGGTGLTIAPFDETTLLLTKDDGTAGPELWKSDGTGPGTQLVANIAPDRRGIVSRFVGALPPGRAIFYAADSRLWKSDGTPGTTASLNAPADAWVFGSTGSAVYYSGYDVEHGYELWRTDGTETGTRLVKDVQSGPSSSQLSGMWPVGSRLYFTADDGVHGSELWRSDGDEASTLMVADLAPDASSSWVSSVVGAASSVFFIADGTLMRYDGISAPVVEAQGCCAQAVGATVFFFFGGGETGYGLWKTNGPGEAPSLVRSGFAEPTGSAVEFAGSLYFVSKNATYGRELWVSNGTEEGTHVLLDIAPGSEDSNPYWLTSCGNHLFFAAYDPLSGYELWKTDGTTQGTVLVSDTVPGAAGGEPWLLTCAGNRLFFCGWDETHGDELWVTDGTAAGTAMFADIEPGSGGSSWGEMMVAGSRLFLAATTSTADTQAYATCVSNPAHLQVTVASAVISGAATQVTVLPVDAAGAPTCYDRTIHFLATGGPATLPPDSPFDAGSISKEFTVTFFGMGARTLTVTDAENPSITGSADVTVKASPATSTISVSPQQLASGSGQAATVTVQLKDADGNNCTSGPATVALSTRAGSLSAVTDNGNGTLSATLTAGDTPTTAHISGTLDGTAMTATADVVFYGPATCLWLIAESEGHALAPIPVTVSALDVNGAVAQGFTGTVTFTSDDPSAVLPSPYVFQPADAGVHPFSSVVFQKVGRRRLSVASSVTGHSASITVRGETAIALSTSGTPSTGGSPVTFTATITSNGTGAAIAGMVTFRAGSTTIGKVDVAGGTASMTTSALASGTHSITAAYGGDSNFLASTSAPLLQSVGMFPPSGFRAAYDGSVVSVAWTPVAGAAQYEIHKSIGNAPFAPLAVTSGASFNDVAISPNTTYLYCVRGRDAAGVPGPMSMVDPVTTILLADDPIVPGSTPVRALHVTQLRQVIDAFRAFGGLSPAQYSRSAVATGMSITALDISELRQRLAEARSAAHLPPLSYSDPELSAGLAIKAAHVMEIRDGAR